jgi:hypothetical protein
MQHRRRHGCNDERAERKSPAPPPQHRRREPQQHCAHHQEHRHDVEALLGEAVRLLVKPHPLQRGRQYCKHQHDLRTGQDAEHHLIARPVAPEQRVRREQQRQHQRHYGDQLEEAAPRILRVCQARRHMDQIAAAEQVAELHDDEREEEQTEQAERGAELRHREQRPRFSPHRQRRTRERTSQISDGNPRQKASQDDVTRHRIHVDAHDVRHQRCEHGIG